MSARSSIISRPRTEVSIHASVPRSWAVSFALNQRTRHPCATASPLPLEVRALRCTCTAGRASKDGPRAALILRGSPSGASAPQGSHLRMTWRVRARQNARVGKSPSTRRARYVEAPPTPALPRKREREADQRRIPGSIEWEASPFSASNDRETGKKAQKRHDTARFRQNPLSFDLSSPLQTAYPVALGRVRYVRGPVARFCFLIPRRRREWLKVR